MNSRIKEHNDNVIHVNFTPEELGEDYIQEEEEEILNSFATYKHKNKIISISIFGILISLFVMLILSILSMALILS